MKPLLRALLLLPVLGAFAPAQAQTPAPAPAAVAAPTAPEGLSYFVGRWTVAGVDPRDGSAVALSYRVEPILEGSWLMGAAESADPAMTARDVWGRDPMSGEIVRTIFSAGGAALGQVRSQGWTGDTLVLEGEVRSANGALRVRETITRLSPTEFRAVWELRRAGAWTAYSIERVTRQAPA